MVVVLCDGEEGGSKSDEWILIEPPGIDAALLARVPAWLLPTQTSNKDAVCASLCSNNFTTPALAEIVGRCAWVF